MIFILAKLDLYYFYKKTMNISFLKPILHSHFSYFNFFKSLAVILPYDANVTIF